MPAKKDTKQKVKSDVKSPKLIKRRKPLDRFIDLFNKMSLSQRNLVEKLMLEITSKK
jgi:hypothetical protein